MKRFYTLLVILTIFNIYIPVANASGAAQWMPDKNLRKGVKEELGLAAGEGLTKAKMLELTNLRVYGKNIKDLTGLEYATNLTSLVAGRNKIRSLTPLENLTSLTVLRIGRNDIEDVSPLENLTALTELRLHHNSISDVTPLAVLVNLTFLRLRGNSITDLSPLVTLVNVTDSDVYIPGAVRYEAIARYLRKPAPGHLYEIPVVIMRFLPTLDGVNLDVSKAADYWSLGEISLEELKERIVFFDKQVKFMLEEGSRFRGYKNPSAPPSIGYRVVEYITVYAQTPAGHVLKREKGFPIYSPDYHQIFKRFNMKDYVNNKGVKEIWIWQGHVMPNFPSYNPNLHKPEDFRDWVESNMSSPVTGDISNSWRRNNDLPVYNSTYTVYGQNFRRSQAEVVHNHGHQLEAILSHVDQLQHGNTDLFWKKFVGKNDSGNHITGRAGWTHMPPNTTRGYDYTRNTTLVKTDIADWTPDNSGSKKLFNVNTYGDLTFSWRNAEPDTIPQRVESQWYIYWMQSMPGHENQIQYGNKELTNWWVFTGDWDKAIKEKMRLVSDANAAPSANVRWANLLDKARHVCLDPTTCRPPDETALLANYPNPFNPETWIPYQLAQDADVQISIYDINGASVRQLDLGYQRAGYYTDRSRAAYWDGRNELGEHVATGIYFYQLRADNMSLLRKMVILK